MDNKHMRSLGDVCNEVKIQYDDCFNTWFSQKFLKGDTNDSICAPLFNDYQQCIKKAMKDQQIELHDVQVTHLGTDKEKCPPTS